MFGLRMSLNKEWKNDSVTCRGTPHVRGSDGGQSFGLKQVDVPPGTTSNRPPTVTEILICTTIDLL